MGTDMDWKYELLAQKYSHFARSEGQVLFPAGRVFGGTSSISHLNYYRESPEYFQQWDRLYGIKNWTYEEVMPFFQKSENNLDSILVNIKETFHKSGGLITVSTANPDPILRRYLISTEKMGYNETLPDGRQPFGVTVMQRMISKEGAALSTSTAYLESKIRPNLHTFGNSFVTKVIFDRTLRATEVRFQKEDSIWTVKARKEIIICAGVVGLSHKNVFNYNKILI